LPNKVLEDIRLRVRNKDIGDGRDYPIHLHQITTIGFKHNRTPIIEEFNILLPNGEASNKVASRVRLYFDGLVAHVHIFEEELIPESYVNTSLGNGRNNSSIVFGMPFEESRQYENIKTVARSAIHGDKRMERTKRPKRKKKKK
jgi:hypothetical protein